MAGGAGSRTMRRVHPHDRRTHHVRRHRHREPLRRRPHRHAPRPARPPGARRRPGHLPERRPVRPHHPARRHRPARALGPARPRPGHRRPRSSTRSGSTSGPSCSRARPSPIDGHQRRHLHPPHRSSTRCSPTPPPRPAPRCAKASPSRSCSGRTAGSSASAAATPPGPPSRSAPRIVIGADGTNSFVARSVGAPTYHEQPTETINVYSYWRGVDLDRIELYTRPEPVLRGLAHQRRPRRSSTRSCPPPRPTATRAASRTPSPRRSPRCRTSPTG